MVIGMGALVSEACSHLSRGGSVLVSGPTGIGKSTLLSAVAAECDDHLVLRCSLAESESQLPFLGLIDLLAAVGDDVLERLPEHERTVLRSALLRGGDPGAEPGLLPLRVAVLDLFRTLSADRPVLLMIDDAQWLDPPSAELLAFVARRAAGLAINVLAAVRAEPGGGSHADFYPAPVLTLQVPVMTVAEVSALLGRRWPRPVLSKIYEASGGNPFFALELGRALAERESHWDSEDPLPLPDSLRALMGERLGSLSPGVRRTLLTASAAARPTINLLLQAGREDAADEVAEAARNGIVEVTTGNVVRFTHPLLAAVVYADAQPADRLRVHTELADTVTDPVERARHLAIVAPGPDEGIAATLSEAAVAARRRGAPAVAARLGRLAADHTPDPGPAADRRLTAAEDMAASGEYVAARDLAHEVLAVSADPAQRVRAWIVVMDASGQAISEVGDVFSQAMKDARDDPALLAPLHYRLAWRAWLAEGSATNALQHAIRSAELAAEAGDRRTEVMALAKQAHIEFFLGRPEAEATLLRALSEPHDPRVMIDHNGPAFQKHRHHLLNDRLEEARTELRSLIYVVRQRGVVESLVNLQHNLARIEIHRGRCERALELTRQSLRLAEDTGLSPGPSWYAMALAEAAGGDLERAMAAAERAQRHSEDDRDLLFLPQALHAEGLVRLMRGQHADAAEVLRRVRRLEERQGLMDPAMRRWHGDLAEALARSGSADEAAELIELTRARARRLDRRSVLAVMDRAAAQVAEERGDLDEAVRLLRQAVRTFNELPFRLEEGRARLALGRVFARRGETQQARLTLREARRVFSHAQARPWLELVAAALDHANGEDPARAPASYDLIGSLSDIEGKVAVLVAEGSTNREIAARLFVSVKTVEAALTRTYRKLGVRSRVDLARLAAGRPIAGA